ncbi:MAG: NnrS family protein [Pseudomonadales bacterium]|nr:NnrS family protein [Pseudomonadales bacterium]
MNDAPRDDFDALVRRLFSYGFRPLFLCTVGAAIFLIAWWVGVWFALVPAPVPTMNPVAWHGHEMLFGMVGSAIGGFLLTAVANWTRRPPVSGLPLALIVGTWLLARLVFAYDFDLSPIERALVDVSYWILLAAYMANEVIRGRSYRNIGIVGVLTVFALLCGFFHFDAIFGTTLGSALISLHATVFLVCILISVIGGRIIPAFTGNWLRLREGPDTRLPTPFNWVDRSAILSTIAAGAAWTLAANAMVTSALLLACGCLHIVRMLRWRGHRTLSEPLLFVLHVGYAWLGIGILFLAASANNIVPASTGIHALSVGAMTGLIVAVSSRAAMGHTNRAPASDRLLTTSFVLINLAAIARVAASMADTNWLLLAGSLWCLAFVAFAIRVAPILTGPPASRESLLSRGPRG